MKKETVDPKAESAKQAILNLLYEARKPIAAGVALSKAAGVLSSKDFNMIQKSIKNFSPKKSGKGAHFPCFGGRVRPSFTGHQ